MAVLRLKKAVLLGPLLLGVGLLVSCASVWDWERYFPTGAQEGHVELVSVVEDEIIPTVEEDAPTVIVEADRFDPNYARPLRYLLYDFGRTLDVDWSLYAPEKTEEAPEPEPPLPYGPEEYWRDNGAVIIAIVLVGICIIITWCSNRTRKHRREWYQRQLDEDRYRH